MASQVRTVKTSSGAPAGPIVHSNCRGTLDIERSGSAYLPVGVELLKAVDADRLAAGQGRV